MCGFTGFIDYSNTDYSRDAVIENMKLRIAHRGPDSEGTYADGLAAMGFRRLSLIDLQGGDQPMKSADGRYVIMMNGEIYNYRDLREQLMREQGCTFRTDSDTEVLLQAFICHGEGALPLLRGMFSFVIWDREERTLFGARDRFGVKPFYYAQMGGAFLFSSEIKSFLEHPCFRKEINPEALKMYLVFQYSPLRETIFKNVYKLEPGTCFSLKDGVMETKHWFSVELTSSETNIEKAAERIDRAFADSVKMHRIADVEVGAFLSGGVDSGYTVSLAKPEKAYTVGFSLEGFDETDFAERFAEKEGVTLKKKEITAEEFFSVLPEIQYHFDEPEANLASVPLYFLAEMAAKDVKAVLSGEGADELFGGYLWYIQSDASLLYRKLPKGLRRKMAVLFQKAPERLRRFFAENAKDMEDTYIGQAFIMDDEEANSLLTEKYRSDIGYRDVTGPYFEKVKDCDDLTKKLYLDMHLWLPHEINLKADKMTMAHSLEMRVPFLDPAVWETARVLSPRLKMRGRTTKPALRRAAAKHVPPERANRIKIGFLVPFRVWLREDRFYRTVKEMFAGEEAKEFFDREKLLKMLEDYKEGRGDYARRIYTVYSFLIWYRAYFG